MASPTYGQADILPDNNIKTTNTNEDWVAELLTLGTKPLSSLKFAAGLERAARSICAQAGAPVRYRQRTRIARRITDIGFSAIGLGLLAPALMVVVIGLRISRPGPILFRAARIGDH